MNKASPDFKDLCVFHKLTAADQLSGQICDINRIALAVWI